MMSKKYPIPEGFVWNHEQDIYKDARGSTWNDETNIIHDRDGNVLQGAAGETTEQMIQRKGKVAARVTPADIDAVIIAEQFEQPVGTLLTICILTLRNGFTVTGESACASPENFDVEIGKKVARDEAKRKIWPLLGYVLREKLHNEVNSFTTDSMRYKSMGA